MKKLTVLLAAFAAACGFTASAFAAAPLVSAAELNKLLADPAVRVIDVRDAKLYDANHIPGAVSAPYDDWRGAPSNPGELAPLPKLTTLARSLGLNADSHAVVVSTGEHATDFGSGAHVYWILKTIGLKKLSLLSGGVKAWNEAGLPQNRNAVKAAAGNFTPVLDKRLMATRDEVASRLQNPKVRLIDARPADFFSGDNRHPVAKSAGTIQGAVNVPSFKWFKPGTGVLLAAEDAKKVAAAAQIDAQEEAINFCNSGQWSATNWFVMSEILNMKNVKMYPGSMVDWTQAATPLPMDNVPGRGKQLMFDAKNWVFN